MLRISLLIILSFSIYSCHTSQKSVDQNEIGAEFEQINSPLIAPQLPDDRPKNIILMIGDGMGLPQISASYLHQKKQTVFSRFPIVGIQSNYSADSLTTDSAAAATAFACGVKTNNRMIGMDPMGNPAVSILTLAENMQKKTGVIVCSSLVHATPAAFFAHNPSRYNYEDLALDFSTSGVDYFVGGGKKFFDRRTTDNRNLYQEMVNNGYYINDYFQSDFSEIDLSDKAGFGFFTADDSPLTFDQGRDYMYAAIQSGIEFLDSDKGFFLLVEGSQIDWGGHARNIKYVLSEMGEFEALVKEALDFAETDGETLVIVTGDHETGGLTINFDSVEDSLSTSFSSKHHSAVMIPVFAYGPGDKYFSGLYENTAIFDKMKQAFGFETSKK